MMADVRLENDGQKKNTFSTEVQIRTEFCESDEENHKQQNQGWNSFHQFPVSPKNFMKSVRNKDINTVKNELDIDPTLATCTDDLGVSALEKAVTGGSVDILQMFLEKIDKNKKDDIIEHALLYAIRENHKAIVEFLLVERSQSWSLREKEQPNQGPPPKKNSLPWPSKKQKKKKKDNQIYEYEDAEYASFITPIVLAAKLERLEMIQLLIDNNASEIHPITSDCPYVEDACEICRERKVFKSRRSLQESNRLLEIYKALSSPGYIFLSGVTDPILEVFELSRELEQMKNEDPSFTEEYDALATKCRLFAQEMLDLCRTTNEVEILLKRSEGVEQCNSKGDSTEFPRLLVALYFQQKEFIGHPNCQQVLQKSWYEGLPGWVCNSDWHYSMLTFYVMLWVPMWPIASLFFMLFKCWPWLIKLMKYPINKFITDTLSFITFVVLLVVNDILYKKRSHLYKAGEWYNIIEQILMIWIIGMSLRQVKMIFRHRHCRNSCIFPTQSKTNLSLKRLDIIILVCFWIWICCTFVGIISAKIDKKKDLLRYLWPDYHVILVSELFYACGTVLSFFKLTGLFQASSSLGPLQLSLKHMIIDVVRFFFIFMFIMSGFAMAITKIYSSYEGNEQVNANNERITQAIGYIDLVLTYKNLYWSTFGHGDVFSNGKIVVGNVYNSTENVCNNTESVYNSTEVIKHSFTQVVGYVLIGSYHVVVMVVLLNMLIGMMTNSYETIEADADREWKFARTRLRMTYYSEVGTLPTPFNIMLIGKIMKRVHKKSSITCKTSGDNYPPENQVEPYKELMEKLSKRYRNRKNVQQKKLVTMSQEKLEEFLNNISVVNDNY